MFSKQLAYSPVEPAVSMELSVWADIYQMSDNSEQTEARPKVDQQQRGKVGLKQRQVGLQSSYIIIFFSSARRYFPLFSFLEESFYGCMIMSDGPDSMPGTE